VNLIWADSAFYSYSHDPKYLQYAELLGDQLLSILTKVGVLAGAEEDIFNIDKRPVMPLLRLSTTCMR